MHFYRGSGAGAARYFDEGHKGTEAYCSEHTRIAVEIDTWRGERLGTTQLAGSNERPAPAEPIASGHGY